MVAMIKASGLDTPSPKVTESSDAALSLRFQAINPRVGMGVEALGVKIAFCGFRGLGLRV